MKIPSQPKFRPNEVVAFESENKGRDIIVFASVQTCIYNKATKEWTYLLNGWMSEFEESRLIRQ